MSAYHGDIRLGDTIDVKFTTVDGTGAPTALASGTVVAYVGNSTTEITAGITLSASFDSRTGLNNVRVVASSGNGYAAATNVTLVLSVGTVGGVSVVGYEIGSFSIENRSAVMPTVAARTLDVSAGGEAGLDWANIGSPTTSQTLSGTTIGVVTLLSGLAANAITATAIASGALTAAKFAAGAFDAVWTVAARILTAATNITSTGGTTVSQTGDSFARLGAPAGASVSADIAALQTTVDDIPTNAELAAEIDAVQADIAALNNLSATEVEDAVWDASQAAHVTAGTTGASLNNASSAGDPWATALPGAYGAGTAGQIVGDNLNATISSRASQTSVDDLPTNAELAAEIDAVQADIAAVQATADDIETDTQDIQSRLPAALVSGRMASDAVAISGSTAAADAVEANIGNLDAAVSTRADQTTADAIEADTQNLQSRTPAALVGGRMNSNVGAINNTAVNGDGSGTPWGP